jgi:hypothetical protein
MINMPRFCKNNPKAAKYEKYCFSFICIYLIKSNLVTQYDWNYIY